jgi:hypothetical protein
MDSGEEMDAIDCEITAGFYEDAKSSSVSSSCSTKDVIVDCEGMETGSKIYVYDQSLSEMCEDQ